MAQKILLAITVVVLLIITNSCDSSLIEPELKPGRRDYVWTVDTLFSPFNVFSGLWGMSAEDVWLVGAGGSSTDRLWHYDGSKWSIYNKEPIFCTGNALWGNSKNNIWMVGGDGKIWHYDGINWSESFTYRVDNSYSNYISDIWGYTGSDIYAVGVIFYDQNTQRAFTLHYNGQKWEEVYKANSTSQFIRVQGDTKNLFIVSVVNNQPRPDSFYVYKYYNKSLQKIISTVDVSWVDANIIGDQVYLVAGNDIYVYKDNVLVKFMNFDGYNFGQALYGRNTNDIFIRMKDGIAHYNGTDIQYLHKFNNDFASYRGRPLDFGDEIFFFSNGLWK